MFGVSLTELLVVAVVVLIVFGPDRLPELLSGLGRIAGAFQKEFDSIRREFYNSVYTPARDVKTRIESGTKDLVTARDNNSEQQGRQKQKSGEDRANE